MTKGQEVKRIGRFALYGSVGFGVGWVFGNAVSFGDVWFPRMVFPGAVGGASLGLALKGWKKAGLLAVAGAIGYVLGYMAMMMALFTFGEHWYGIIFNIIAGAIWGAVTGISLGLALRNWVWVGVLALAGAAGFGIGWAGYQQFTVQLIQDTWLPSWIQSAIAFIGWPIVGGAFLGASLGYLEKRRGD